ncbi:hypothetical protein KP509_36G060300 [Ceratopteris richardii]|uniref:Uncharacterized protein n=1 Tax=Ceratopteris richardii TaxID=49495 RepID=A0A8T2QEW8_CERRI|nr:hypothetical protein KP509_36G060300 [Ceratopteris richardii]
MATPQSADVSAFRIEFIRSLLSSLSSSGRARGYRRLNPTPSTRRRRVRLSLPKFRKLRVKPILRIGSLSRMRLRLAWMSPSKLLAKLRDAYVTFLQAASYKIALTEGLSGFPGAPSQHGFFPFQVPSSRRSMTSQERELDKMLEVYLARLRLHLQITDLEIA